MSQTEIITSPNGAFDAIPLNDRPLHHSADRLRSLIRSYASKEDSQILADLSVGGDGQVTWRDVDGRGLTALAALPADQAQKVRATLDGSLDRIEKIAATLAAQGDAGQLAAQMLRLAMVNPDGQANLYATGDGFPVLVNWGHAAPGQVLPGMASAGADDAATEKGTVSGIGAGSASTAAAPAVRGIAGVGVISTATAASNAVPAGGQNRGGRWGWLAWLLPLMLVALLAWLVWWYLQPNIEIVHETPAAPETPDPVPPAAARLAALKQALDDLSVLDDDLAKVCVLPPEQPKATLLPRQPERRADLLPPVQELPELLPKPAPVPTPTPKPVPKVPELPKLPPKYTPPPRVAKVGPAQPQPASICEKSYRPMDRPEVMVVVDGSGSMKDSFPGSSSRLAAAKSSVGALVNSLHKEVPVGVVSFSGCSATQKSPMYGYRDRGKMLGHVNRMSPGRATSLARSLTRAANSVTSLAPATIVVVSDGADTCGGDPCAVARGIRARRPNITINVIDLSGSRSSVLSCVAGATGGQVLTPRTASQMRQATKQASGQPDASQCK